MHNREPITLPKLWASLKDYDLWPIYVIGILFEIPMSPPKVYLTLSLKKLGFSKFNITLMQIPPTLFTAVNMLWATSLTERFHQIIIIGLLMQVWILPLVIIEYTSVQNISAWGQYALMFFIIGQPSVQAPLVGLCSRNSNAVRTRAVSAALFNIMIQLSGIASSNIYRSNDSPLYKRGNRNLIAITGANIVVFGLAKAYYVARNRWKQSQWQAMSTDEKAVYLDGNETLGNKRLDFFFDS